MKQMQPTPVFAAILRTVVPCLLAAAVLTACPAPLFVERAELPALPTARAVTEPPFICPVTQPQWLLPPDDPAVLNEPAFGYYYVNADLSMWAAAGWVEEGAPPLQAGAEGVKVGWFRPAGAPLAITGVRLDGEASPLDSEVPCCYPTRFQASGLYFPTAGCWQVSAAAAGSELTFVVEVAPGQ